MEINPAQRAGRILRMMREDAGLSQEKLGKEVFISPSMLSYIESGTKPAKRDLIERIGNALNGKVRNIRDILIELWGFTTIGSYSTEILATQEAEAIKISDWEPNVMPGLAQTPGYARAIIRSAMPRIGEERIEELVDKRMERQQVLARDEPPMATFILDESALRRPFGGKAAMREQLMKLEALAELPSVLIQVMEFSSTRHPGFEGPLRIMEFPDNPPIWYTEGWHSGRMTDERDEVFAAMIHFDLIRASALSPERSVDFIASIRRAHYE